MPSGTEHSVNELLAIATRLTNCIFRGRELRHLPAAELKEPEVGWFTADFYLISLEATPEGWVAKCFDGATKALVCRVFDFDTLHGHDAPLRLAEGLMGEDCPQEMAFVADIRFDDKFSGQRSYWQKRFRSKQGDVLLHMRRVPDGVEHVFEVPEHANPLAKKLRIHCHSVLWHESRQEYEPSSVYHGELPDWTIGLSGRRFAPGPNTEITRTIATLWDTVSRRPPRGRGFYQYSALSVRTHFDFGQAVAANRDWCTSSADRTWTFKNLATAELHDISALLISQHERQHYRQMITSPWGLLIFRIQLLLNTHVVAVLRNLSSGHVAVDDLFPLIDWHRRNRDAIRVNDRELHDHLNTDFSRIEALSRFMNCIVGLESLSPRDFVHSANACLETIEQCLALPPSRRWQEPRDDAVAAKTFSVLDVVEAAARMQEYNLLRRGENDRLVAEWRHAHFKKGEDNAFSFVLDELRDPMLASFALDAALQGLVDPSWASVLDRQLEVTLDHPGERLQKIVAYLLKHWDGTKSFSALNAHMCANLPFELIDDLAAAKIVANVKAAKKLRRLCSKEFEWLLVEQFCAGVTRRGMLARAEGFDLLRGMTPVYEIWNDRVVPGDQSIPATFFYDDLQLVLLQAQLCEAALTDGVLDEDFVFRDQLKDGKFFGRPIDSQFTLQ